MQKGGLVVQLLSFINLFGAIVLYFVLAIIWSYANSPRYPKTIHWEGYGQGWLASLENTVASFTRSVKWVEDGYSKHNKNNKSWVLPSTFGTPTEIVIPRSQMQWLLEQPDHIISATKAHKVSLHGDYSFVSPVIMRQPYHEHVLHRNLGKNLHALIAPLSEEIADAMDLSFGMDAQNWTSINLMAAFFQVIPKVTNRMLVGKPLCRNQEFVDNCLAFAQDVGNNLMLFSLTPEVLRPFVGRLASLPPKWHFRKTAKHSVPVIKQRLEDLHRRQAGDDKGSQEPKDYITWQIKTARTEGRHVELEPTRIAQRLLTINFASIHTTAITAHSTMLDLLTTDPKLGVLDSLREEAESIYREGGNRWTKQGLARMYKIDSAIRESMRINRLGLTLTHRMVVAKEGLTNPTEGWHAPYGTMISCPLMGAHTDPDLHDDPEVYDPFRYSRLREEHAAKNAEERSSEEVLKPLVPGMVTTSDRHFPFGHGRHACPGRFLVAHELKMMVAYLVMNYDVKMQEERPRSFTIGRTVVPPMQACVEVKRREKGD